MGTSNGFVEHLRFVGRSQGAFKALRGFNKGRHSVPDAVNPTTQAFLAKLSADELAEEAERFFQLARSSFDYKRKDLQLDLSPATAVLTAKDFTFEIVYSFSGDDPTRFEVSRTLRNAADLDVLQGDACSEVFASQFSELVFGLTKGAPVETVIDAIEALEADNGLTVHYPSDCQHCTLSVPGVDAQVRFDGTDLAMIFGKTGTPHELVAAFLRVREAFQLTKAPILSGLLGPR